LKTQVLRFQVLAVTDATAVAYATLRVELKRKGGPIPANDAWIAALALQHRMPVLSRDSHFDSVSGLRRATW
jgi:predicted nucleic acid-binding protein